MPIVSDHLMTESSNAEHAADVEITSDEAWDRFDEMALRFLGYGGSEFIYRLENDSVDLDNAKVSMVRAMLPVANEAGR